MQVFYTTPSSKEVLSTPRQKCKKTLPFETPKSSPRKNGNDSVKKLSRLPVSVKKVVTLRKDNLKESDDLKSKPEADKVSNKGDEVIEEAIVTNISGTKERAPEIILPGYEEIKIKEEGDHNASKFSPLSSEELKSLLDIYDEADKESNTTSKRNKEQENYEKFPLSSEELNSLLEMDDEAETESNARKRKKDQENYEQAKVLKRVEESAETVDSQDALGRVETKLQTQNNINNKSGSKSIARSSANKTKATVIKCDKPKEKERFQLGPDGRHHCFLCYKDGSSNKEGMNLSFKEMPALKEHYSRCFYQEGIFPNFISPGAENTAANGFPVDDSGQTNGAMYRYNTTLLY